MIYPKNKRLVTKLILSYMLLIALPFSLSVIILGKTSTENIRKNTLTYINLFVTQINSNIDSYISELDRMTKVAMLDTDLCEYLTSANDSAAYSYEADQYLSRYMLKLMTQQPNIQTVTFTGSNGKVFTGTSNSIQDMEAFRQITRLDSQNSARRNLYISPAHIPSYLIINSREPVFCVVRSLYSLDNTYIGSIVLNIVCRNVLDIININPSLLESGARIIITNTQEQIIADTSAEFNYENLELSGAMDFSSGAGQFQNSRNMYFSNTSRFSGLTTAVIIDRSQLFQSTEVFRLFSTVLFLILMAVIFILSTYFSFRLVKPIRLLQAATEKCAGGNYNIHIPILSEDEIGMLCGSFNTMASKIKNLLESVYLYQIQNKQAQLEALQNQINPHFLHNTLETIRMKALINKDREVANMIKILARLFRITLDRTHNVVSLKEELEHVQTYIDIQNMRFNNRFRLAVCIPDELLNCSILKLTMQPIVENCIVHGFSQIFEDETITIEVSEKDSDLFIHISDNGMGIDQENLDRIIGKIEHSDTKDMEYRGRNSIGIINISERIQLEYGANYYLTIKPAAPHGTAVTIKIPKNEMIPLQTIQNTIRGGEML